MEDLPHYSLTSPGMQSPNRSFKSTVRVEVVEARLTVNVAKFGDMKPYVVVAYGTQMWKTSISVGMKPSWNSFYTFTYEPVDSFQISLFHKAMLIGDVEIGKSNIKITNISRGGMEWWELFSSLGEPTGNILLCFEFYGLGQGLDSSLVISSHNPTHPTEVRDDFIRWHDFDADNLLSPKPIHPFHNRPVKPISDFIFPTDDQLHIEQMRKELDDEKIRISRQEEKVKKLNEALDAESDVIKKEKEELRKFKEEIMMREEQLMNLRDNTESEKRKLEEEKRKFEEQKETLNRGYERLKKDKLKLKAKRKLLESASQKIDGASRKLEKQKQEIQRQILDSKEQESTFQQEWEEIEDMRTQLKEKEEQIQLEYDALTKEKESLELERHDLEIMKGLLDPVEHDIAEEETDKQPISVMVISEQVKHRVVSSESSHVRLVLSPAK